ncbi:hypothetical protein NLJ89_g7183 [Agrocybe chaxingu]|uniref:Uncharacterized protein n=1 Tax=Agrocybe chaxingu TaxID=84603 RepID=A0A9W8JXA7_9AGAR|nr:hypothetical protein NLJ89_g7183 [Agrocybe chaxingu]
MASPPSAPSRRASSLPPGAPSPSTGTSDANTYGALSNLWASGMKRQQKATASRKFSSRNQSPAVEEGPSHSGDPVPIQRREWHHPLVAEGVGMGPLSTGSGVASGASQNQSLRDRENSDSEDEEMPEERDNDGHQADDEEEFDDEEFVTMKGLTRGLEHFQQALINTLDKGFERIWKRIDDMEPRLGARGQPSTSVRHAVKKPAGFPVRRTAEINDRQRNIREHLKRLCPDQSLALVPVAEAWQFEEASKSNPNLVSCSADAFRYCIEGPPRCAFNKSSARVFMRNYAEFYNLNLSAKDTKDIYQRVLTAFKSAKRSNKVTKLPPEIRLSKKRASRRYARKYQRRLEACLLHPRLAEHEAIIRALGIEGMSSDESDYGEVQDNPFTRMRAPRYYILHPRWRNPSLTGWLQTFDSIYSIVRRTNMQLRGAYPRSRYANGSEMKMSQSKAFVRNLPISAYKKTWLDMQPDMHFTVGPAEEDYPFTHDPEVIQYIQAYVLDSVPVQ